MPPDTPTTAWADVRRVLALRVDNLGDVLMTTPALAAIKHALPQARLTLLTSPSGAALRPHLPMVDTVIAHDVPWVQNPRAASPAEDWRLVKLLGAGRFDAAVIFTVCTQSALPAALMCRLAGIPLRLAHSRENPYELLSDWAPETDLDIGQARHEVQRQLDLVARVGLRSPDTRLRFALLEADRFTLEARLRSAGLGAAGRRYIVVHPGATAASRRWPAARFGQAADGIAQDSGCTIVFTGSAGEQALVAEAQAQMQRPSLSLAGALSLGELGVLIANAQALVSNNSGPVHLAAAVGTPVVDLYALTNPQHTPWQVPARVLNRDVPCRNCLKSRCPAGHHDCLLGVAAPEVADATLQLLDQTGRLGTPVATGAHR